MTLPLTTILTYAPAVIIGLGYAYGQFFKGKNQQTKEEVDGKISVLELLRKEVDALTLLGNEQEDKIIKLTKEVHDLKDLIELKDKKLKEYMDIFQNRSPQLEEFISFVSEVSRDTKVYMKQDTEGSKDRDKKLDNIMTSINIIRGAMNLTK